MSEIDAKKRIKNKYYREFLDTGIIRYIQPEDFDKAINNIKGRQQKAGRAILIMLYYTGARPTEVLKIRARDIERQRNYVKIMLRTAKSGRARVLYFLCGRDKYMVELVEYAKCFMPDVLIFHQFVGKYHRKVKTKAGKIIERIDTTDKLRYHIKKWFAASMDDPVPPYFLRHNRLSRLASTGATDRQLMQFKGARSFESIEPYIHYSEFEAKKLAKKIK